METMTVRAKSNPVPREDNSRRYITAEPVVVPMSAYYLRRLADGEIEEVKKEAPQPSARKKGEE
jgi:hypothetical protein